ncbi:hypothetical protein FW365_23285 [Escherichia coli]|nr:hypothetical protein [Escherichia coli]EFN3951576.1 hypothetical protein [Escherichia coli]EFW2244320.1 hypothetical protein [Shigella sonnei]OKX16143.1 hypothetical protein AWP86_13870 [Escherichia coli]
MHPQFLVWCLTFGAQFKNDGHYFCRAGGNRPDGLNEPVTHEEIYSTGIIYLFMAGIVCRYSWTGCSCTGR